MKLLNVLAIVLCSVPSFAQTTGVEPLQAASVSTPAETTPPEVTDPPDAAPQHAAAKILPPGYETRAKIHRYASIATLPLFATELWLGQSLYNGTGRQESKKGAHIAVGSGIIGLFGVNTVTGVWNMWQTRKDPEGRTLRLLHGTLMLAANAGFLATAATGPSREEGRTGLTFAANRSTHRDIAIASIGVGSAGYLVMLLRGHH